ncbi:MAG: glutathione S-transferase family protein [Alphaproteobacteria bacterium]|nr:glutathione S-transferase family protein [Alphaproteobacteria bacterium]
MAERRTLYHYTLCPFSRKVRLLLFEKGLPYGMIFETPWLRRPEFLKLNPFGEVPVLIEPDGHILSDHVAICEYINEIKTLPNLLGETPRGRAEIRRLTNLFDTSFYMDVFKPLVGERVFKAIRKNGAPESGLIRIGRANLNRYMGYIDWLAARRSYLGGRNLSMADLGIAAHISILDYLGEIDWNAYPDAKIWYAKMKSRPSFNTLLNDKLTGILPSANYADLDF